MAYAEGAFLAMYIEHSSRENMKLAHLTIEQKKHMIEGWCRAHPGKGIITAVSRLWFK